MGAGQHLKRFTLSTVLAPQIKHTCTVLNTSTSTIFLLLHNKIHTFKGKVYSFGKWYKINLFSVPISRTQGYEYLEPWITLTFDTHTHTHTKKNVSQAVNFVSIEKQHNINMHVLNEQGNINICHSQLFFCGGGGLQHHTCWKDWWKIF